MPYIDIHNERVWIPERPLRSMDEARPMRDGDLWRCPACGRELDEEENDDGTITLVCPAHQVGWDAGVSSYGEAGFWSRQLYRDGLAT